MPTLHLNNPDTPDTPTITQSLELLLFTPRHKLTGERVKMRITHADYRRFKLNSPKPSIVHDYLRNRDFIVKQAACELPHCKCDATYDIA
jgi:hypothetical protein